MVDIDKVLIYHVERNKRGQMRFHLGLDAGLNLLGNQRATIRLLPLKRPGGHAIENYERDEGGDYQDNLIPMLQSA
jgi:hypothetical protein